jgi:hypothetical protein
MNYDNFVNLVKLRKLPLFYKKGKSSYTLITYDGPLILECVIMGVGYKTGNDAPLLDFEVKLKATAMDIS